MAKNIFQKHPIPGHAPSVKEQKAARQMAKLDKGFRYHQDKNYEEAERLYSEVLEESPSNTEALLRLGMLSYDLHHYQFAVDYLQKALRKKPSDARILAKLAQSLHRISETRKALQLMNKAIRLQPDFVPFHHDKINLLADLGLKAEAIAYAREILAKFQNDVGTIHFLTDIHRFKGNEPEIGLIRQLLETPGLSKAHYATLYRAIGKIEADLNNHEAAFNAILSSNRELGKEFDLKSFREANAHRRNFYTEQFFDTRSDFGINTRKPVFIVGMPRSGTTLIEQILASHPNVFGAGELIDMKNVIGLIGGNTGDYDKHYSILRSISKFHLNKLADLYLKRLTQLAPDSPRVTDKLPHNFLNIGLIALMFPNATIIHSRRNPVDNCISCFMSPLNEEHNYTNDLTILGQYYQEYSKLMDFWNSVLPGRILNVQYENVVADLEVSARKIVKHCDLDWDPRCLEFYETERSVSTISRDQVRQPVYKSSVKRWKRYGNGVLPLIEALGPLAEAEKAELLGNTG